MGELLIGGGLMFALFVFCTMNWKEKDAQGRRFFSRLESKAMLPNDRTFLKLMGYGLGAALIGALFFGVP